jgi:hypothetical protein
VFANRVLRRIFGLRKDEVTGGGRKLHEEEVCDDQVKEDVMGMNGEEEECIYDIGGKAKRKETTRKTKI